MKVIPDYAAIVREFTANKFITVSEHIEKHHGRSLDTGIVFYTELIHAVINSDDFKVYTVQTADGKLTGVAEMFKHRYKLVTDYCQSKISELQHSSKRQKAAGGSDITCRQWAMHDYFLWRAGLLPGWGRSETAAPWIRERAALHNVDADNFDTFFRASMNCKQPFATNGTRTANWVPTAHYRPTAQNKRDLEKVCELLANQAAALALVTVAQKIVLDT